MFSQQEIDKIKEISCVDFLESRGYKPRSTRGRTYKYMAPWRAESKPSVCVYTESNSFVDFGNREIGGSVIQLAMALEGVGFGRACEILSGKKLPTRTIEIKPVEDPIKIISISEITSVWLFQYLAKRHVPLYIAQKYCKQVRVELKGENGMPYRKTCIGFINDLGGYELRNARSKLSNAPKWWTTINKGQQRLCLFEGLFDFLSAVTLWGTDACTEYIVLNSVGFITHLDFSGYTTVCYYCDNDETGSRWFEKIDHPNKKDCRGLFWPHKDVNEMLVYIGEEKYKKLQSTILNQ